LQDTKLDVLNILANVANGSRKSVSEVRSALQGISEWFDEYMSKEESTPGQVRLLSCNWFTTLLSIVEFQGT